MQLALPRRRSTPRIFPCGDSLPKLLWLRRPGIYSPTLWYITFFLIGGALIGTIHYTPYKEPYLEDCLSSVPVHLFDLFPWHRQISSAMANSKPTSGGFIKTPTWLDWYEGPTTPAFKPPPPEPSTPTVTSSVRARNSHTPLNANTRRVTHQKPNSSRSATTSVFPVTSCASDLSRCRQQRAHRRMCVQRRARQGNRYREAQCLRCRASPAP